MSASIEERLWYRVVKTDADCWEFTGYRSNGYGTVRYQGRTWRAHRMAWFLTNGPIPEGLVVMHACDNPPCINPAHLSLGTVADNNRDRHAKGRTPYPEKWAGYGKDVTHCIRGHEYTEANTRWKSPKSNGKRVCRACNREWLRTARQKAAHARAALALLDRPTGEPQPEEHA